MEEEEEQQGSDEEQTITVIMAALSALSPPHLLRLSHSISALFLRHHRRLSSLLSSPSLFSLALLRLRSLSLPSKSLLLARHLLSSLVPVAVVATAATPPPPSSTLLRLPDYDAVLLLLLLCELHHYDPHALSPAASHSEWRAILCRYYSDSILSVSGIGGPGASLILCIQAAARCRRLLGAMGCKAGRAVAASPAAVVALPSVAAGGGVECAICREEMWEGRDVCELPCQHLFHWSCILPWARKRNTCPCCRFQLPSDDVFGEIERLWEALVKIGGRGDCT
ncbi:E3 ubiquitin-protein ligase SGR9, amyloplastic [Malania oleifera]|uniref:E3 ubiquitin-protein ligase SGR9, amyloplastic n=1 Tax=Malania oleifera TaxID=397392 RepID=UPI0025AEB986|nr:E3 ubiquitin-protein ligase SGR9, amyloplastic [Malania oleifera]